ncbi:HAD family hydrolase [Pediococcus stilesii]|uniref:HAD family hydrolase n=1 Tax=Pediococcus stilesii TaxID=331679 RepID=A0A0R2L037_9LACO|nr:HAD hydrolase-like protein [Pediococcus stilesii]KRN95161.1 hypothetical protein IV81_GL000043 [Pediococcus stilesii]
MQYKCLILDHDDTAVDSTATIHYPSFIAATSKLRPNEKPLTLDEFIGYCFNPGFSKLCTDIMKFTPPEQTYQQKVWHEYTDAVVPTFFPHFISFLEEFKRNNGIITVVTQSESKDIYKAYQNTSIKPDAVFGWKKGQDKRKPNPHPVKRILSDFELRPEDAILIDDLEPGLKMASECNVPTVVAAWSPKPASISSFLKTNHDHYFKTVDQLANFILN